MPKTCKNLNNVKSYLQLEKHLHVFLTFRKFFVGE